MAGLTASTFQYTCTFFACFCAAVEAFCMSDAVTSPASSYVPSDAGTSDAVESAAHRSPTRRKKHKNTTYSKSNAEVCVMDLVNYCNYN